MKKKFSAIGAFALMIALVAGIGFQPVFAANEKFVIDQLYMADSTHAGATFFPVLNNGTLGAEQTTTFASSNWANEDAYRSDLGGAIALWANSNGYSGITSANIVSYSPVLAAVARSGSFSDVTGKPTTLSGYGIADSMPMEYWHNGSAQTSIKHVTFTGTTTSGTSVFYLTNDGTSGGSALCSSAPKHINIAINDSANTFGISYAVTNSNKTLTVTANVRSFSSTTILGIGVLGSSSLTAAANGTPVNVLVECN